MKNRHTLLMLICCLLPLLGFGVAWLLGVPLGTLGIVLLFLFCPLSHIFMMRGMGKKHDAEHDPASPTRSATEKAKPTSPNSWM